MNRSMKAKNDKRKKLDQKLKKERFYDQASHRFYNADLPSEVHYFWNVKVTEHSKMWWE